MWEPSTASTADVYGRRWLERKSIAGLGERILLEPPRPIEWLAQPGAEARGQRHLSPVSVSAKNVAQLCGEHVRSRLAWLARRQHEVTALG